MLVYGINVVKELLNSNTKIEKILAESTNNQDVLSLLDQAKSKAIKTEIVDRQTLDKITHNKKQGIVAFIPNFKYCGVEDIFLASARANKKPFIVILDGIEDPHNLGAIVRTCECAGVDGIIIPENRACEVTDTVYSTSAGAVVHTKIARVTNLTRTINELKQRGVWVYALEAGSKHIYEADFTYPTAIIVGSEGKGVSRLVKDSADEVLSLDMFGKVNSLNASNAAAVAIYEVVRQRRN